MEGYGFNTRRRRSIDLSKAKGDFKRPRDHTLRSDWDDEQPTASERVLAKDDLERQEQDCLTTVKAGQEHFLSISQSERDFSEPHHVRNTRDGEQMLFRTGLPKVVGSNVQQRKLTIYMDKGLLETIEKLKKEKQIPSYSWLVAESIRHFLQFKNEKV